MSKRASSGQNTITVDKLLKRWTNFQGNGQIMKVDKLSDKVDKISEKVAKLFEKVDVLFDKVDIHSEFFIYSSITN